MLLSGIPLLLLCFLLLISHIKAFPFSNLRSYILLGMSKACSSRLSGDSSPQRFAAKHSATSGPELRPRKPSPPNTYSPS
jgi:hypothetical protein